MSEMGSIEDLKIRIKDTPLSEILGRYIPLSKKGAQTLAVCPFHDDHDPSLTINDQKGMWFCFVDNFGGDAIRFVMLYKKLEFMDSLRDICEKMGWNFEDFHRQQRKSPKIEMGKKLLLNTTKIYCKIAQSKEGSAPFKNFLTQRNLNKEVAKLYQLGLAPNKGVLFNYLSSIREEKERNFALQIAQELGLIKKSSFGHKSHYDTFRHRIIFPIWDHFGQVIGFTSRTIDDQHSPKYLNSIDSFLFNKREILYGLHLAKNTIRERDQVIIVEGNMDQIAMAKSGFENTVALMGVALGEKSLAKLIPLTKNVILCLDNDKAGWKAAERINIQFMKKGLTPLFLDLSPHKDPDDFLNAEGANALSSRLEKANPFIDEHLERLLPKIKPELAERKLDLLYQVFEKLAPLKEGLSATERCISWAKKLGLNSDPSSIIKNYSEFLSSRQHAITEKKNPPQNRSEKSFLSQNKNSLPPSSPLSPCSHDEEKEEEKIEIPHDISNSERSLLQNLVQNPELLFHNQIGELLDFVGNDEVKRYLLRLKELMYEIDESEYVSIVNSLMNNGEYSIELAAIVGGALYEYRKSSLHEKVALKMIEDIKKKLQMEQLKEKKASLKKQHLTTQTKREQIEILSKLIEVDKKIAEVRQGPHNKP